MCRALYFIHTVIIGLIKFSGSKDWSGYVKRVRFFLKSRQCLLRITAVCEAGPQKALALHTRLFPFHSDIMTSIP